MRLHSACLTGDVFGSSRCDCGDQLKLATKRLNEEGGGVILYLEQEGRGLGLANKMRAYALQDEGLDTVDANTTLGFDDDERDYGIAARMLQQLGCTSIYLMTNNPAKLDGLKGLGIEVVGRKPLHAPINQHNRPLHDREGDARRPQARSPDGGARRRGERAAGSAHGRRSPLGRNLYRIDRRDAVRPLRADFVSQAPGLSTFAQFVNAAVTIILAIAG